MGVGSFPIHGMNRIFRSIKFCKDDIVVFHHWHYGDPWWRWRRRRQG
jgi:hypothetical protein